jgi:hypothetical protein
MKTIYLSLASLIAMSSFGQKSYERFAKEKSELSFSSKSKWNETTKSQPIWSNDFSQSSDWIIANTTNDNQNWAIVTTADATLALGTGTWVDPNNEITNENGYALFNSDKVGKQGGSQDATITFSGVIDLSGNNDVVLTFPQRLRRFSSTKTYIGLSPDGGSTWKYIEINANKAVNSVFQENAELNVSSEIGGKSNAKIRFRFVGTWDYAWMVDDVKLVVPPADDIRALPVYFFGANNLGGVEYGRTPLNQLDSEYEFGGQVYNKGLNDQTNVVINGAFTNGASTIPFNIKPTGVLKSNDTLDYSAMAPANFDFKVGKYIGEFTVTSDGENNTSSTFSDNTVKRSFEITEKLYSLDGVGVYPAESRVISSLASNSLTDMQPGNEIIFGSYYDLRSNDNTITGIEIIVSSTSDAGADIQVSIIDTATLFNDGSTPVFDLKGNEALSDVYTLSTSDINKGIVTVYFQQPLTLESGAYFAAVNAVNDDKNNISIIDDRTVLQPSGASMINIPGDGSYSNGNAFAIRLLTGTASIDELGNSSFSIYPNPADEAITIKTSILLNNASISILDLNGKELKSMKLSGIESKINTSDLISGVYFVRVSNGNISKTEKLIIKK